MKQVQDAQNPAYDLLILIRQHFQKKMRSRINPEVRGVPLVGQEVQVQHFIKKMRGRIKP